MDKLQKMEKLKSIHKNS